MRRRIAVGIVALIVLAALLPLLFAQGSPSEASSAEFFETRVRPVLAKNCVGCHGPEKQFNALRVDSEEALRRGGKRGPAVVPGHPEQSLLVRAVRHDGLQMPVGSKLKDSEIAALEEWVRQGARWPKVASSGAAGADDRYRKLVGEHWAFQPVAKPALPRPGGAAHPVDQFLLAALQKAGLSPAKPAGKRLLVRRLSFVLTGLPPSPEEVDRFVNDTSPDAYERLVDRLLASPHFGEHWARHWLDLVRYGETRGYEWNYEIIGAWRYRDYLIRAFNADVPYDQLVREHIAGDLLEQPRIHSADNIVESPIGTAFYRLGEAGHDDCIKFREIALDVIDNQIDTLTKTFQGLTVSCARCHDHKLDPVPTEDYYSLYSILNSSRPVTHTIDAPAVNEAPVSRLAALKEEIRQELAALWVRETGDLSGALRNISWRQSLEHTNGQMEDPSYAWATLACENGYEPEFFPSASRELADRYRREAAGRAEFNQKHFEPFGDFRQSGFDGWWASGMGLRRGWAASGDFVVSTQGETAVAAILPAGAYTHLVSGRLNGALRSPYLPKSKKFLSLRAMGGSLGARRTIIDNCAIGENNRFLDNSSPQWIKLDTISQEKRLPVYVELVTRPDNPRIPDRPGVLKKDQLNLLESPVSYFGIVQAVLHDVEEPPREDLSHMMALWEGGAPSSWDELARRYSSSIRQAVNRWARKKSTDADVRWLEWLLGNGLVSNDWGATPRLRALMEEYRDIESKLSEPRVVEGLADMGPGQDFPILVSGDAKSFGDPAPRRFLKYLFSDEDEASSGSGRRQLADRIASPANPLTARVMVNRIWSHVFGRGLVASVDNLGVIGDKPTHPELLDYLAARFVEEGWSIKKTIRLLVLSQTFRQSSEASASARETDPENRLLHHYPMRRLSAEELRDAILAASGTLNPALFGPSIQPYREQAQDYRRLMSGPLDGGGRRSIYTKITRMEGPKFLEIFDYPNPMATRGSRDVTNVPAQALALLNDPFVVAEAGAWARRLLERPTSSTEARIEEMFRTALGRRATAAELERFRGLAAELASLHGVPREQAAASHEVWKDVAHAVFNLKEFIYIQ